MRYNNPTTVPPTAVRARRFQTPSTASSGAPTANPTHPSTGAPFSSSTAWLGPGGPRLIRRATAQDSDLAPAERRGRNRRWLEAYERCRHAPEAISLRNRLVECNLPLVVKVAAALRHHDGMPFDDMVQVGSLGLIRAIEAWDGRRGSSLSSFAVPYIRGAIQREFRDRLALLRVPRTLWELRQRANALQEQRRRQERPGLSPHQLATALGCGQELLEESLRIDQLATPCSLDAPRPGADLERPTSLLELLADPASLAAPDLDPEAPGPENPEYVWLRRQWRRLDPAARDLLEARLLEGCSWPTLARRAGISPATARRRVLVLLRQLRQAAEAWRGAGSGPAPTAWRRAAQGSGPAPSPQLG